MVIFKIEVQVVPIMKEHAYTVSLPRNTSTSLTLKGFTSPTKPTSSFLQSLKACSNHYSRFRLQSRKSFLTNCFSTTSTIRQPTIPINYVLIAWLLIGQQNRRQAIDPPLWLTETTCASRTHVGSGVTVVWYRLAGL